MKNDFTLFLMTKKGWKTLKSLINKNLTYCVKLIVIGKDKSLDDDCAIKIEKLCKEHNLKYTYDKKVECLSQYAIAISWRWLLNLGTTQLIVIHDSLLPKYRGFSPLVNQLINGETKIGATALFASKKYDEGNIIIQKKINISYPIKINQAIDLISELYSLMVLDLIKLAQKEKLKSEIQNHREATYSLWRDEKDYFINWKLDSKKIKRTVDALGSPYEGAKTFIDNEVIVIQDVEEIKDLTIENRDVGKVIFFNDIHPVIVCGKGLLIIKNAYYEKDCTSIFPLKKFRIRLNNL